GNIEVRRADAIDRHVDRLGRHVGSGRPSDQVSRYGDRRGGRSERAAWAAGRGAVTALHEDAGTGREIRDRVVGDRRTVDVGGCGCRSTDTDANRGPERVGPRRATGQRVPTDVQARDRSPELLDIDAVIV